MSASASDSTAPLASGSLELPFSCGDVTALLALEQAIQAKRRGGATSPLSPEAIQADAATLADKVLALTVMVQEGQGEEAEWMDVVQQHEFALYRTLVLILAYIPMAPTSTTTTGGGAFHALVQTLYILGTLRPDRVYATFVDHPPAMEKLLQSIFPELAEDQLAARLRLVDSVLVQGYGSGREPAARHLQLQVDFEDVLPELLACLAASSASVFGLAAADLLLLNTLDAKRTLHRLLMSTQAQLSSPVAAAASAAAASAVASPSPLSPGGGPSLLSTSTLSRFSQELITLLNSGRLPPTWVDEGQQTETRSGTDRGERRMSVGDLYESTRAVVQPLAERDPTCHALTSATLAFVTDLFRTDTAMDLFYTNDIQVLVEVILRRMEDEQEGHIHLTLDFLLCLSSIVGWGEFRARPFKLREIADLLALVQANHANSGVASLSPAQLQALTEQEVDERETRAAIEQLAALTREKLDHLTE